MTVLRAAVVLLLPLVTACGGARPAGPAPSAAAEIGRTLTQAELLPLEVAGVAPGDTVVTFATGRLRKIILRHGPPDNTVFVELAFPADAFSGAGTPESVTVSVRPLPGLYGVTIESSLPPGPSARVRFKYPVHFAAPRAALERFGSRARYERALLVLVRVSEGSWGTLTSTRPASDNLEAPLRGTGAYLVAAPR